MEAFRTCMELAVRLIEALAVVLMLGLILIGTVKWLLSGKLIENYYARYRVVLGRSLLVGLELSVAADIIRTIALNLTLADIATLAALIVVRTFLGWTLAVEFEGRWPWRKERTDAAVGEQLGGK